jgi:hypothetical protein
MGAGNRGGEIEDPQACEAACQIPLIIAGYGHCVKLPGLLRPFVLVGGRDPKLCSVDRKVVRLGTTAPRARYIA